MKNKLGTEGYVVIPAFIHSSLLDNLRHDLSIAYDKCREIQVKNGVNMEGSAHHIVGMGASFFSYLERFEEIDDRLKGYFGGKYIINTFGGNILRQGNSYANYIHRDQRSHSLDNLMLNTLLMLDDFTADNGATRFMRDGHRLLDKPSGEEFDKNSFQITGHAGDLILFNANMWHKAGENRTENPRRALTVIFSRPFIKPQFAYDKLPGVFSPYVRQLMGHHARVPETHEQFYQKKHYYEKDQG